MLQFSPHLEEETAFWSQGAPTPTSMARSAHQPTLSQVPKKQVVKHNIPGSEMLPNIPEISNNNSNPGEVTVK